MFAWYWYTFKNYEDIAQQIQESKWSLTQRQNIDNDRKRMKRSEKERQKKG